ncbi:anaerobic C4-dicarboxylate transporter family protein, partial [Staphylococcus capitis]|uniref:anaerobic C4-dicarboxylate transporter family protein n=1 Tax=Staphylococcus capitis TaxID=29388 RepID=UPI0028CB23F6
MIIFIFPLPPPSPPLTPLLIILSIPIPRPTLQPTPPIHYLLYIPSPLIQPFPKSIIFIPPIILFLFLFPIPTPNIPLSLQPIIPKTPHNPHIQPK